LLCAMMWPPWAAARGASRPYKPRVLGVAMPLACGDDQRYILSRLPAHALLSPSQSLGSSSATQFCTHRGLDLTTQVQHVHLVVCPLWLLGFGMRRPTRRYHTEVCDRDVHAVSHYHKLTCVTALLFRPSSLKSLPSKETSYLLLQYFPSMSIGSNLLFCFPSLVSKECSLLPGPSYTCRIYGQSAQEINKTY